MKTIDDAVRELGGLLGWDGGINYVYYNKLHDRWIFTHDKPIETDCNVCVISRITYEKYCNIPTVQAQIPKPIPVHAQPAPLQPVSPEPPPSSIAFLNRAINVQSERGMEYTDGNSERSFQSIATTFNAITGQNLSGSDVCLMLTILKLMF